MKQRAVILGGSVAGLCAAAAVRPHVDEVVILERDDLPVGAEHRTGAPQSKHPHFLLNAGRDALETLMPGIEDELVAAGAVVRDPAHETAYCEADGWSPRQQGQMTMLYASRLLIERVLRERVRSLPGVTILERAQVSGLAFSGNGADRRVCGVHYTQKGEGAAGVLESALVVDCLGRGTKVPAWLVEAGFPALREQTLDAKAVYSSRWYEAPPTELATGEHRWWSHLAVLPATTPGPHPTEHEYLSTIFPIEHDRWIVFMGSWGLPMPQDSSSFEAAAAKLRTPVFSRAIADAEPLSDVHVTRSTGNRWRRYDELDTPPAGLLALGDAICAFNPLYGQGMSAAACSAVLLAEELAAEQGAGLSAETHRRFLDRQRKFLSVPWSLAMLRDQGYAHAEGTEKAPEWKQKVMARVTWPAFLLITNAGREDPVIEHHFSRVFNIQEPIGEMLRNPRVLFGMARYLVKRTLRLNRLPSGFDIRAEPPGHDYSPAAASRRPHLAKVG